MYNAKQLKSKGVTLFLLLSFGLAPLMAQKATSTNKSIGRPKIVIGSGVNIPSSKTLAKSNSLGDIAMLAELEIPIKPLTKTIDWGIRTDVQVTTTRKDNQAVLLPRPSLALHVEGESTAPTLSLEENASTPQSGLRLAVEPHLNIRLKNLCISPGVGLGFMLQNQKALKVTQTTNYNGTLHKFTLLDQDVTKTNGLLILPRLKIAYCVGPLDLWLETQYLIGPSIKINSMELVPVELPNANGNYNLAQLQQGTMQKSVKEKVGYRSIGLNLGLSIPIAPLRTSYQGHVTLLK